jgi:hypothetical protein
LILPLYLHKKTQNFGRSSSSGPATATSFVTDSALSVAMATANGEFESGARSQAVVARVHAENMLCAMVGGNA